MDSFRTLTLLFCTACITTGLVRQAVPGLEAQQVIKTVCGLYILLAVLQGAQSVRSLEPADFLPSLQAESGASVDVEADICAQAQQLLASRCEKQLRAAGIPAEVSLQLAKQADDTYAVSRLVIRCGTLSPEQRQEALDIAGGFGAQQVLFADEEQTK